MAITKHVFKESTLYSSCTGFAAAGKRRRMVCYERNRQDCSCAKIVSADSLQKANLRLRSLDEETQIRISKKYYGGFRPWIELDENLGGRNVQDR